MSEKLAQSNNAANGLVCSVSTGYVTFNSKPDLGRSVTVEELAHALKIALEHSDTTTDIKTTLAVYIPPAQQLRNAADALEKKDNDIYNARMILNSYNKYNKETV